MRAERTSIVKARRLVVSRLEQEERVTWQKNTVSCKRSGTVATLLNAGWLGERERAHADQWCDLQLG